MAGSRQVGLEKLLSAITLEPDGSGDLCLLWLVAGLMGRVFEGFWWMSQKMKSQCHFIESSHSFIQWMSQLWLDSMKSHFDEKPFWWKATSMKSHFDEKPLWWKAALMKSHFDEKPLRGKAAPPKKLQKSILKKFVNTHPDPALMTAAENIFLSFHFLFNFHQ
jgi:hypothetical protein